MSDLKAIADRLIAAYDGATTLPPITADAPEFSVADGYAVLHDIETRRRAQGWRPIGRKIGFTNRTIWPRYGVYQPMWAHVWSHTVRFAADGKATLSLQGLVQPRIEPEVVFKLKARVPVSTEPAAILSAVEWIAPGFEIVQSHFPDWKFTAADCAAAFGLHGALVVGTPVAVTDANRADIGEALTTFRLTLSRGHEVIDRGIGSNVLDSPALALAHLARLVADQPWAPPLAAGEIVTTGTVTDAWPVKTSETWSSDYGKLGIGGLTLKFEAALR
jgi:2-oxo-3-hexenedioate decarboxylase